MSAPKNNRNKRVGQINLNKGLITGLARSVHVVEVSNEVREIGTCVKTFRACDHGRTSFR
jgi:hypothetical protein